MVLTISTVQCSVRQDNLITDRGIVAQRRNYPIKNQNCLKLCWPKAGLGMLGTLGTLEHWAVVPDTALGTSASGGSRWL